MGDGCVQYLHRESIYLADELFGRCLSRRHHIIMEKIMSSVAQVRQGLACGLAGARACCLSCRRNRLACVVSGSRVRRARGATTLHVHALYLASAPSRPGPMLAVYPERWPYVLVVARFLFCAYCLR